MKRFFLLIPLVVLASCIPDKSTTLPTYPIPKGKPVAEVVDAIQRPLDDASQSSTKLTAQIQAAKDQADRASQAAEDAEALATRYRDTLEANKAEWAKIVESIGVIKKENLLLKTRHDELATTNLDLTRQLGEVRQKNVDLIASAAQSDQKIDLYEQQFKADQVEIAALRKAKEKAEIDKLDGIQKARDSAASVQTKYDAVCGQRNLLAMVAAGFAAWQIIKLLVFKRF
jgi:chromosome segregation ATPase